MHRYTLPLLILVAACGRGSEPALQSHPANAPVIQAGAVGRGPASEADRAASLTSNDLDKRTAELFGDALRLEAALSVSLDTVQIGGGDETPTWDLDVRPYETYDRVRHYVQAFTGASRARFSERLSDGTRYEALIRARMRAASLPEDMYYLALIESGFNPYAYSRAAAVGMWQFMTTTAKGMGLRVDWWVDERRDPVRSTEAAVRFLRGLNEQFGSMYLAAAAYNGGPGRIARGLNRYAGDLEGDSPDDMFFTLAEKKYLKGETRNYVPQLIAAALVAKEPGRHGLEIVRRDPFVYDSAWVPGRVPLAALAAASGSTVPVIQDLNPHILRGMTAPAAASDSIKVRIPLGTRERFDSAFAGLPAESTIGARTVTVAKGATWASIAKQHKITAKALALYNPKVKPSKTTGRLPAGVRVMVPSVVVVAAALPVPDPAIERYGSGTSTHVVRQGENLSVIAKRYRTTPAAIMRLNRLKKPMIFPGQELLVTRGQSRPAVKAATKKATTPRG